MKELEQRSEANPILRVVDLVSRQRPIIRGAVGAGAIFLVGMADWWTGPDLAFSIFYLLPVCMVAWHLGPYWGALLAAVSTGMGLFSDLMWSEHYASPLIPWWNAGVRFAIFLTMVLILGALRTALDREKSRAHTDSLTGIFNRRAFYESGKRALLRARRYEHPLTLVYLDLDSFKTVNDQKGHRAGDVLLRALSETIQRTVRETDLLARIGGDEFGVILPHTDSVAAKSMMERLVQAIAETMDRNGWPVTISAGVVTFQKAPESMDEIIQRADDVMYRAKRRGENSVEYEVVDA